MATSKRKRKSNKNTQTEQVSLTNELLLLGLFAFCVILILGNFGMSSIFGDIVNSFFFGILGLMAYVWPFYLFIGICFYLANRENTKALTRLLASFIVFIDLGMLMQCFFEGDFKDGAYMTLYEYAAETHKGGGALLGGMFEILKEAIGNGGTILLILLILIICAVLITGRSFVKEVEKSSRKVARRTADEGRKWHEERVKEREYKQERKRQLREQQLEEERRLEEERLEQLEREERARKLLANNTVGGDSTPYPADDNYDIASHNYSYEETPIVNNDSYYEYQESVSDKNRASGEVYSPFAVSPELRVKPVVKEDSEMHEIVMDDVPLEDEYEEQDTEENEYDYVESVQKTERSFDDIDIYKEDEVEIPGFNENNIDVKDNYVEAEIKNNIEELHESPKLVSKDIKRENDSTHRIVKETVREEVSVPEKKVSEHAKRKIASIKEAREKEAQEVVEDFSDYEIPPIELLEEGKAVQQDSAFKMQETAAKLQSTLKSFGVNVRMTETIQGPTVTRYEMQPEQGVKVSKILGLIDDIKLSLAATDIRIEAPIPGKAAIGIEVPNEKNVTVKLRDIVDTKEFKTAKSKLSFALGKNIGGEPVVFDIAKMPHLLIAGATGSGKSVCINTIIMSILYKANPDEVKMIMIDPKVVELSVYNGLPHLLTPVVTDPQKAAGALKWGVAEMMRRYNLFAKLKVRDMKGYNNKIAKLNAEGETDEEGNPYKRMPQIVIIVDELADLMMVAKNEVETSICRLTQLARAAGIHLIIATQRPSVDVITGLIKANMPSRIAFAVSSGVDSRTILDMNGAERLLGKGDMLFYPQSFNKPERVQGTFVTDEEVQNVVDYILEEMEESGSVAEDITSEIEAAAVAEVSKGNNTETPKESPRDDRDQYFEEAGRLIIEKKKASIGMLQRVLQVGFNRAARIMDSLAEAGVVSGENGTKARTVLMTMSQFEAYLSGEVPEEDVEAEDSADEYYSEGAEDT